MIFVEDSRCGNKIKDFGCIGTAAVLITMFWVYIIKSGKTGCYYIGQTGNLTKRLDEHNNGRSRFTKAFIPWELVYSELFSTRAKAMKREKYLKSIKKRKNLEEIIAG